MIKRVGAAHAEALAWLHADVFGPDECWSEHDLRTFLLDVRTVALLDERGGFSLTRIAADEAEILTLGVAASVRRQGIAGDLIATTVDMLADMQVAALYLEVSEQNQAAMGLYSKLGFVAVGKREKYYNNLDRAIIMRLGVKDFADPSG
jgi:ribosomal-protein-alanine N-acetyltransferase